VKLVVLSNPRQREEIFLRNVLPPLEDSLASLPDSTLVSVPATRPAALRPGRPGWLSAIKTVRRADTVFWGQFHLHPGIEVWGLAYSHPLARRAVLAIEQWESGVEHLGRIVDAQHLHACFVLYRQAYIELRRRFPELPFVRLPLGFNRDVFRDLDVDRDIYAFSMGRRHEPLHEALSRYCAARGLVYRYSMTRNDPPDVVELNRLTARSRYFVVTPPDLQNPERTGRFSPITSRYLEGAGAGARLLGVRPRDLDEYGELLPPDALVECAPNGDDLDDVLTRADADPAFDERRIAVRDHVHREHGWERRAETIYDHLRRLDDQGGD
jgi:hypothetical protein